MSEHRATISWKRTTPDFAYETYNRDHDWTFDAGLALPASAAPAFRGNPDRLDPEEAFVAALSSCHMLTFLAIAAREGVVVDSYEDHAVGILAKNPAGRLAVTRVTLRPAVAFAENHAPSPSDLERLHAQAHRDCFLANSVRAEIVLEPRSP